MDLKLKSPCTPKGSKSVSRFGRKITPKKKFDSSSDDEKASESKLPRGKSPRKLDKKSTCTPKRMEVDNVNRSESTFTPKTPYSLRQRIKTRIQSEVEKEEQTPFSLSEESEWDDSESDSSDTTIDDEEQLDSPIPCLPKFVKSELSTNRNCSYVCGSGYLEKTSRKSHTSSQRLKKLDDIKALMKTLSSFKSGHESHIAKLEKHYQNLFHKWMYALSKGFNVIVYGLGSKKALLDHFKITCLKSCRVLVINGYFPGLSAREILSSLFELLGKKTKETVVDFLLALNNPKAQRVFILIHNIDGLALRVDKTQTFLSQLASHDKIHVVASIDHINSPLLWDQKKLSHFNFIWDDCATYLPYNNENCFEGSLMVQTSTNMALSSLRNVFRSLNKNSRTIFKYLLEHSLNPTGKSNGMQFSELYRLCRRNFIVSSDLALRAQLTEFIDHQLVRWIKERDILTVCVEKDVLKTFKLEIDTDGI